MIENRIFVITGASSGLGKEFAFALAKRKAKLFLASRNIDQLSLIKKELSSLTEVDYLKCDIVEKKDCKNLIDQAVRKFGKIDYLIANAGVSMWNKFSQVRNLEDFKIVMETNYLGNVYLTYYLLDMMKKKDFLTKIVYMSSLQSILGLPYHSGYGASKHALGGFIKVLSAEEKELPILTVLMGWVRGTNIRQNSLGKEMETTKPSQSLAILSDSSNRLKTSRNDVRRFSISRLLNKLLVMESSICVEEIIKSLPTNQSKLYLPKIGILAPWLYLFFPKWVEKKIDQIVSKEKHVGK